MKKVYIYRNQLFKISESFITNQAESLKNFSPIYIGRKLFSPSPVNAQLITLDDCSRSEMLRYVVFRDISVLLKKIGNDKPKLIHAYFGVEAVYAIKLAKYLKVPIVTSFLGFDATTNTLSLLLSGKPSWINFAIYKRALAKNGDLFLCVSDFIRHKVIAMGFPEEKTITHYIGVDVSKLLPSNRKISTRKILHVARLTEKKGTEYLLKALSLIEKKYPDTELLVIGGGPLQENLQEQAKSLGLVDNVIFLGELPHSEMISWMKKVDIFCLPSITARSGDSEGLPMSILEASSLELPVVSTYHAGIPEAIIDGVTGYLVEEKKSVEIADRLIALLGDDSLRRDMGKRARELMVEKFNLKVQNKKLEMLYDKVIDECTL